MELTQFDLTGWPVALSTKLQELFCREEFCGQSAVSDFVVIAALRE
jgi:hypothetical protein